MKSLRREVDVIRKQLLALPGSQTACEPTPQEKRLAELLACVGEADVPEEPPAHLADMAKLWPFRDVLPALLSAPVTEAERQAALDDDRAREALCCLSEWAASWQDVPADAASSEEGG